MNAHLATTIALYGLGLSAWATLTAMGDRPRSPLLSPSLALLEAACVLQAVLTAIGLLGGHRPAERATHLGYLAASVLVLPLALASAEPGQAPGRWEAVIASVGCLAAAVVALRLHATWRAAGDA